MRASITGLLKHYATEHDLRKIFPCLLFYSQEMKNGQEEEQIQKIQRNITAFQKS